MLENVVRSAGLSGPLPSVIEPLIATLAASQDCRAISQALEVIRGASNGGKPEFDLWQIGAAAELLDSCGDKTLIGRTGRHGTDRQGPRNGQRSTPPTASRTAWRPFVSSVVYRPITRLTVNCSRGNSIRRDRSKFSSPRYKP